MGIFVTTHKNKKNINRKDDFFEAVFNYSFDTEFFNAI